MKTTSGSPRIRSAVLAVAIVATSFVIPTPEAGRSSDDPIGAMISSVHALFAPKPVQANFCASNPSFNGYMTSSSASTTDLATTTTGSVYGYISLVGAAWSCTAYFRYSGLGWNVTSNQGRINWGNLINSTTTACNWLVGETNYLKGSSATTCHTSDAQYAMQVQLSAERIYQADVNHDSIGDISFTHSDCGTYYGPTVASGSETTPRNFDPTNTFNRPGDNCDPITLDAFGGTHVTVYDATAPTLGFDAPATGTGPVAIPSAFYTVQFDAIDAVAKFGGANGWTLQRQVATWSGTACGSFANDTAAGNLVTGTTEGPDQLSGQSLAVGRCYRWILDATDQNGNSPAAITSGSIRVDTGNVLGLQGHLRTETWDLGAGDSLSVSPGSGNVVISHPIVDQPIRGSSVNVGLTYNSQDSTSVGFGPGWRLNVQRRLSEPVTGGPVTFTDADGSRHTFAVASTVGTVTTYNRPATIYGALVKDTSLPANEFILTYRDQSKDKFDILGSEGILVRAEDRFGNGVTLGYVGSTNQISTITDTAGSRTIDFAYSGTKITSITDWAYISGGVVQTTAIGSRRATRFFYDASSNLIGWADGLNTAGSCPTGGSHLTCLTLTGGVVSAIGKTQTVETISGTPLALGSTTRAISTQVVYSGADVAAIKDAEQVSGGGSGATFSHPGVGQTKVVRPGTPASETTYTLASANDALGRITSVRRKLGAQQIEQRTTYDAAYPLEPATVVDNYVNGIVGDGSNPTVDDRTTSWTYVASSLGLVSRMTEPLTASTHRTTDYTYNSNNDLTQKIVALDGSGTTRTITRYCYDASCTTSGASTLTLSRLIDNYVDGTAGNGIANVEDVTTTYLYDGYGQQTRATRANYNAAGTLLDSTATGHTYDNFGNVTADIANYANGSVSLGDPDDITPSATTNARTDLTTAYTYDTAGNRATTADPRRAIETAKGSCLYQDDYVRHDGFDAMDQALSTREPTTASPTCPVTPGLTTSTVFDELGGSRQSTDPGGVVTASEFDRLGHATRTFEDADGVGNSPAATTSTATFDAAGRALATKDRRQAADSSLGYTSQGYDELGRTTSTVDGSGTIVSTTTSRTYDALDRVRSETAGTDSNAANTTTTFDLGGRATAVDDEFTCTTTTYDYRDLAIQTVQGLESGTCAGGTPVTTTISNDELGRVTVRQVTAGPGLGDQPRVSTYDAIGNTLVASGKQGGVTTTSTYTVNPLGQVVVETRTDGSTAKSNYDPAGNATDRCYWKQGLTVGACLAAGTSPWTNPPTQAGTSGYDARNQRISLTSRLGSSSSVATTTYDPNHNYQISAFYLPTHYNTANPPQRDAEAQDLYHYDSRHRLDSITHQRCAVTAGTDACTGTITATGKSTYGYDDNDNRTTVAESSTDWILTTRNYCYDALNRLTAEKLTTTCASSPDETFVYDDAGNRSTASVSGATRTFAYGAQGQLGSCATPSCAITYDDAGRSATITDNGASWTFAYDAEGRVISACKSTACSGSIDRADYLYDGSGHRTQIKETTSAGGVTTMDLRYEGDTVVQELVGGTISRTYASDDTGRIVQVCDPDCAAGTIYVVVYNGHGDATGLWRKNADGTLTLANSYTYTTWGAPTTMAAGGFGDLKFRFLYVGASDVQWDSSFGLNLHYMHSRHYSPTLGRFIQPDPSGVDSNLYAYAENDPITRSDPKGLWCEDHAYICGAARAGWKWARGFVRNVVRWGLGGDISRLSRFSRFATHEVRTVLPRISSHAWKRLAERGVTVRQAEAAVRYGTCFWDPKNLSVFYIIQMASGKYIGVAESVHTWIIKTVEYGTYKELRRPRMILGGYGCNQSPYR